LFRVWDRRSHRVERLISTPSDVRSLQITQDGSTLSVSMGTTVSFFDVSTYNCLQSYTLPREIDTVAYEPVRKRFVTGSMSELWVRAYDMLSGSELIVNKGHHGPVRSLAFTPSGANYASGSEDGTIRIWEWTDEKEKQDEKKSN
jgi:serine-threonine kinase receptor-associated protein